jgi:hypothetical protein
MPHDDKEPKKPHPKPINGGAETQGFEPPLPADDDSGGNSPPPPPPKKG